LFLSLACLVSSSPQVNHELDTEEDLLAVDSFQNEVAVSILPPPPEFAGKGDRLTQGPARTRGEALVYNNKMNKDGSYAFNYETSDGQKRQEEGKESSSGGYSQTGGWEYVGADGKIYSVTFVADENGFRPVGLHLPTPPPMPAALARFFNPKSRKPKAVSGGKVQKRKGSRRPKARRKVGRRGGRKDRRGRTGVGVARGRSLPR